MTQEDSPKSVKDVAKKNRGYVFTVARKRQLIKVMEATGNKKTACAAVDIEPAKLDMIMAKDHQLYKKFKKAEAKYLAALEQAAYDRAVNGVTEKIFYKGAHIDNQQRYSDDLLKTLLKAADKDKYGNKTTIESNTTVNVKNKELRGKLANALGVELPDAPEPLEDSIDGEYEDINE